MIKERGPKVSCKDAERRLASEREERRREVQPRPYQPPLPYTRFSFNIDVWEDAWVKKRMP